jgi:hypothetical protein
MKNLLLLLVLANILYFIWEMVIEEPPETGVAVVEISKLGPPLQLSKGSETRPQERLEATPEAAPGVGAMLGTTEQKDLAAVVGRSCVSIGPFTSGPEAQRAFQDYRNEDMRVSVRSTKGEIFVGHWVQIRDIPDRQAGNNMIDRLVAGGITDAYLVPTDDEGLKISLGLFGEMNRAERLELQAEAMNMQAEITPRMREDTVYYVDIALPPGRGAGTMIERFGEERVLLREQANCPGAG